MKINQALCFMEFSRTALFTFVGAQQMESSTIAPSPGDGYHAKGFRYTFD